MGVNVEENVDVLAEDFLQRRPEGRLAPGDGDEVNAHLLLGLFDDRGDLLLGERLLLRVLPGVAAKATEVASHGGGNGEEEGWVLAVALEILLADFLAGGEGVVIEVVGQVALGGVAVLRQVALDHLEEGVGALHPAGQFRLGAFVVRLHPLDAADAHHVDEFYQSFRAVIGQQRQGRLHALGYEEILHFFEVKHFTTPLQSIGVFECIIVVSVCFGKAKVNQ